MAIDFPNSPSNNDTFNVGNVVWIYSGGKWILQATAPSPLPVSITSVASGQFLKWNGTAWVNDAIDLGTDTTGSYVTSLVAGSGITLSNNSGESATPTVAVDTAVIQARVTNVTDTEIGYLDGVTSAIQTQMDAKAPLASPSLTGTPLAPTAAALTNTTQIATTAFVATAVASAAIATLDEIGDVSAATPSSGQFLKWNGSAWVPDTVPTINALDDIGNVTAPSPTIGEVLTWNGTAWVDSDAVRDNMIKFYMEVI